MLPAGCFENYLSIRQPTEGWPAVLKMLDWLSFYDQLDKRMKAEHTFDLLAYAPFTFVAWHPLFASVGVKSFDWPKVDYEVRS
jgi:chromosome transmission fidelity protein 18